MISSCAFRLPRNDQRTKRRTANRVSRDGSLRSSTFSLGQVIPVVMLQVQNENDTLTFGRVPATVLLRMRKETPVRGFTGTIVSHVASYGPGTGTSSQLSSTGQMRTGFHRTDDSRKDWTADIKSMRVWKGREVTVEGGVTGRGRSRVIPSGRRSASTAQALTGGEFRA